MNILIWNCNMAFRKKYHTVLSRKIDLAIISECEHKEKLEEVLAKKKYNDIIWHGNNPHKGIAVISFNQVQIKLLDIFNPEFEYVLPIQLTIENRQLNLLAIWAMPNKMTPSKSYVGQIWGAINYYNKLLKQPTLLAGDFNSNTMWDTKRKIGTHTHVVSFLSKYDIHSIYHQLRNLPHGSERQTTLYLLKKKTKPYHIDYCFASSALIISSTTFKIGTYKKWIPYSDHMPIWVENLQV